MNGRLGAWLPVDARHIGGDNRIGATRALSILMRLVGFEPTTSRMSSDNPPPAARSAGENGKGCGTGALPLSYSLIEAAGVTRTRDPLGRNQVLSFH
jgi:hypothetical protein